MNKNWSGKCAYWFVKSVDNDIWATSRKNMSSGISDQERFKPACSATEAS